METGAVDARYARKSEGLSTAGESKTRVWLSGNEAGGALLLPGQRRTLGGGARNFTGPRIAALSTTLVSPQSARYPLSRPGILLLLFHPLSPEARGVDSVMRLHQRRRVDFRRGKRLGKEDILLDWTKPAQRPETLSAEEIKGSAGNTNCSPDQIDAQYQGVPSADDHSGSRLYWDSQ